MGYICQKVMTAVLQCLVSVALIHLSSCSRLFDQLKDVRAHVSVPLIVMGYFNPMMQYGVERFCQRLKAHTPYNLVNLKTSIQKTTWSQRVSMR